MRKLLKAPIKPANRPESTSDDVGDGCADFGVDMAHLGSWIKSRWVFVAHECGEGRNDCVGIKCVEQDQAESLPIGVVHPMPGGTQLAVRQPLEHVADDHDEAVFEDGRFESTRGCG